MVTIQFIVRNLGESFRMNTGSQMGVKLSVLEISTSYFCKLPHTSSAQSNGSRAFIARTAGGYSLGRWAKRRKKYVALFRYEEEELQKNISKNLLKWVDESSFNELEQKIVSEYENRGKQFSVDEVIPEEILQQALQALGMQSEDLTSTLPDDNV